MEVMIVMPHGGRVSVAVCRHHRARRFSLSVSQASRRVLLTIPKRGSVRQARLFAIEHAAWIEQQLNRLVPAVPFVDGARVPVRGRMHTLRHMAQARGPVWLSSKSGPDDPLLCVAGRPEYMARRVTDYLKKQAKQDLVQAVHLFQDALKVSASAVRIGDQKSRWGSCSESGCLSFSWRLVLAPPFVLDYLAAHEVSHLVVLDHSAAFWRTLEAVCPTWRRARDWLHREGPALHAYGASEDFSTVARAS